MTERERETGEDSETGASEASGPLGPDSGAGDRDGEAEPWEEETEADLDAEDADGEEADEGDFDEDDFDGDEDETEGAEPEDETSEEPLAGPSVGQAAAGAAVPVATGARRTKGAPTQTSRAGRFGRGRGRAEPEAPPSPSDIAVRIDDRVSQVFVVAVIVTFVAIFAYALLLGEGGILTPLPTPSPVPSAAPSASAGTSASPSALPSASESTAPSASPSLAPSTSSSPSPSGS